MIADESLVLMIGSVADQTGKIFHPYVVMGFLRSLDQKEIDAMRAVTFFAHM